MRPASQVSLQLDRPSARPGERGRASVTGRAPVPRAPSPSERCGSELRAGRSSPCVTGACQHCPCSWGPETGPPCFQKIHGAAVGHTHRMGYPDGCVWMRNTPEYGRDAPRESNCTVTYTYVSITRPRSRSGWSPRPLSGGLAVAGAGWRLTFVSRSLMACPSGPVWVGKAFHLWWEEVGPCAAVLG